MSKDRVCAAFNNVRKMNLHFHLFTIYNKLPYLGNSAR